jgi:tetratricopeptide (TPR) repeat protein
LSDRFVRAARAAALLHDGGTAAGRLARLETLGDGQTLPVLEARWRLAAAVGDWPSARATAEALMKAADLARAASQASAAGFIQAKRETVYEPWLALSQARTGQVTQAQAVVGQTPLDCYLCVRARAQVAAAAGDRAGADRWFAEAVRQGPSLPYAHLEWGQAKLARGDVRGALAELAKARSLGPRFADASEAWGEALLASGDAAAAEQKFQAAAALAPRWGRLHLKWGEALARRGRAEDAHSQFKAASALSLSAPDRAELAAQHV